MKPDQQKEDEPNPAQKYFKKLIVVIEVLATILTPRPAPVSNEQRFWGSQFLTSAIAEGQFVPGISELHAPLSSTKWLHIVSAAAFAAENNACICWHKK